MSSYEKREEVPPPIPKGCKPLSHQVAGHIYGKCKTRAGLLQDGFGSILKLLQTNNRGMREKKFYQIVFGEEQSDPMLLRVRDLVAPFRGAVISEVDPSVEYIKLADMTLGFSRPCIMDVKIGRIGYKDSINSKKVEKAKMKYPHMDKLGFQILGMRVYHPLSQKYSHYDKMYGRSLDVTSMIEGLAKFFNVQEKIRTDVMFSFLVRLQQILDWFEVQTNYHFFSSSLLFIYEANISPDMLETPEKLLAHSANLVNGTDRTSECDASHESEKPDTYPIKRKKTGYDENCPGSDHHHSARNMSEGSGDVKTMTEGGKSVEVQTSALQTDTVQNHVRQGQRHNGFRRIDESVPTTDPTAYADGSLLEHNTPFSAPAKAPTSSDSAPTGNHVLHRAHSSRGLPSRVKGDDCNRNEVFTSEGGSLRACRWAGSEVGPCPVEIRMIDFAHAIESTTRDENYIFGLNMLMQYIETLHNCYTW